MKEDNSIDPKLIGTYCTASDPYYGDYKAEIRGCHKGFNNSIRIDVTILECLSPPSDRAIINKQNIVRRMPYPIGSVQHFDMESVKPLLVVTA